jgi:hypothetical protein
MRAEELEFLESFNFKKALKGAIMRDNCPDEHRHLFHQIEQTLSCLWRNSPPDDTECKYCRWDFRIPR